MNRGALKASCAVADCHRRMGGVLAVELEQVGCVELAVCREHGDAVDSGAPFGLQGARVVMGDALTGLDLQQPPAVWDRLSP